MQLTAQQFEQIADLLPRQRGNVSMDNLRLINAILYVAVNGCTWRALPRRYGNWHTIYTRTMRWSRAGVLDRVFERLQRSRLMAVRIEAIGPDANACSGTSGKTAAKPLDAAAPKCLWLPRLRAMPPPAA